MGSTVLPFTSLRMTMGKLVTGSIISPRIFISTSMKRPSQVSLHHSCAFAHQRVRAGARHPYREIPAEKAAVRRMREVERAVVGGTAHPLPQRLMAALYQHFLHA